MSRRAVLVAGLWLGLIGCGRSGDLHSDAQRIGPAASATSLSEDARVLIDAITVEQRVGAVLAAAVASHRSLRGTVTPLQRIQVAHVRALRSAWDEPLPVAGVEGVGIPRSPAGAERAVRRTLAQAAAAQRQHCLAARSGPLARLLASVSAAHAVAAGGLR